MAHGYALLGSIMPMRTAQVELGLRHDSTVVAVAKEHISTELGERPGKPTAAELTEALGRVLGKLEKR